MRFKDTQPQLQLIAIEQITPDPAHPRKQWDEASLKSLSKSIKSKGLIQPVLVQAADDQGRFRLIVGERRWRAAQLAGETVLPALVHPCGLDECLEIQVFENLGLGVRAALEPRDMAQAIQTIAERFESRQAAAEHFGRPPTWLNQATAAANLSPKVSALLDSGKIASTNTAIQLDKLAQKNTAKADTLIEQIEQLPEGEKLPRNLVKSALAAEGSRRAKHKAPEEIEDTVTDSAPAPLAASPAAPAPGRQINPGKIRMVAQLLGLAGDDEETVLVRLIDEFLALKGEAGPPF